MPTATSSLRITSQLLQEQPALLAPPFLIILLSGVLLGSGSIDSQIWTLLSVSLLNLAVTGGWYRMIVIATRQQKARWDDFLTGIGQHFTHLVLGTIGFFAMFGLGSLPLLYAGLKWAGDPRVLPIATIQKQIINGKVALIAPEHMLVISQWMIVLCGIGALYGILSYFLLLWTQAVVVREGSWIDGWKTSIQLTVASWKPICAILTVNLFAWMMALLFRLLPLGILGMLIAASASLVAEVYFRMAFTVFCTLKFPKEETKEETALA